MYGLSGQSATLLKIAPLNSVCATTVVSLGMNLLLVLLLVLSQLNSVTHVVGLGTFKVRCLFLV